MKKWIFTLFLGMIISTSCKNSGSPDKNANASLPYQIDLEQRLKNVRSVDLDILGNNLEYVLFETNPECEEEGYRFDGKYFSTFRGKLKCI